MLNISSSQSINSFQGIKKQSGKQKAVQPKSTGNSETAKKVSAFAASLAMAATLAGCQNAAKNEGTRVSETQQKTSISEIVENEGPKGLPGRDGITGKIEIDPDYAVAPEQTCYIDHHGNLIVGDENVGQLLETNENGNWTLDGKDTEKKAHGLFINHGIDGAPGRDVLPYHGGINNAEVSEDGQLYVVYEDRRTECYGNLDNINDAKIAELEETNERLKNTPDIGGTDSITEIRYHEEEPET